MNTTPLQHLATLLADINDPALMYAVLEALLSDREVKELENRIQILKLLGQQKSQRDIAEELGVGIATVTRGAKVYRRPELAPVIDFLLENA